MRRWAIILFGIGAFLVAASQAGATERDGRPLDGDSLQRLDGPEMVYDGLIDGRPGTPCEGLFEVAGTGGLGCTHGPDPAPPGVDPTRSADPASPAEVAAATDIACEANDDGASGYRVHMIYAHESGQASRYATYADSFVTWSGNVEAAFADSADKTGADLHVRWVHDGQCNLAVDEVQLPAGSLSSIGAMANALRDLGYTSPLRKYHVFADSTVYCGVGYIYNDDSPSQLNNNNGRYAMYSRTDAGCWGRSNSVEAHEIMHNLGGVQTSAPNATQGYHCVDNADRMCYNDGSLGGKQMQSICPSSHERLFDCGDDDYFYAGPSPSGYLATHWNTARSRFLWGTGATTTTSSTTTTLIPTTTTTTSTTVPPTTTTVPPTTTTTVPPTTTTTLPPKATVVTVDDATVDVFGRYSLLTGRITDSDGQPLGETVSVRFFADYDDDPTNGVGPSLCYSLTGPDGEFGCQPPATPDLSLRHAQDHRIVAVFQAHGRFLFSYGSADAVFQTL